MGIRGRKSAATITDQFMANGPDGPFIARPDAPYSLTDQQAEEWRAIVNAMPVGYFARSHYPLLTQLCRHIVASNRIAMLIEQYCKQKKIDHAQLASFHAMQGVESTNITRLARSMRLTHQALYRADSTKQRPVLPAPWDREE